MAGANSAIQMTNAWRAPRRVAISPAPVSRIAVAMVVRAEDPADAFNRQVKCAREVQVEERSCQRETGQPHPLSATSRIALGGMTSAATPRLSFFRAADAKSSIEYTIALETRHQSSNHKHDGERGFMSDVSPLLDPSDKQHQRVRSRPPQIQPGTQRRG